MDERVVDDAVTSIPSDACEPSCRAYKQLSSEVLAAFVAQDDKAAWNELYARHWAWVVRLVLSRASDSITEDDAYDWAQESMLRAWRYRHTYNPTMDYRKWLRTVVVNYVVSQLNQIRRRRELLANHGFVEYEDGPRVVEEYWLISDEQSPDEHLAARERSSAVQRILQQLGKQDQEVLKYWSEGRLDEYGQRFRVKPSTLRSRVSRARRKFREVAQASGLF